MTAAPCNHGIATPQHHYSTAALQHVYLTATQHDCMTARQLVDRSTAVRLQHSITARLHDRKTDL
jgi:hypothetical protein